MIEKNPPLEQELQVENTKLLEEIKRLKEKINETEDEIEFYKRGVAQFEKIPTKLNQAEIKDGGFRGFSVYSMLVILTIGSIYVIYKLKTAQLNKNTKKPCK
jgi:hypothetical protein